MRNFGLIGKVLQHSYSQRWFETHFATTGITDATYSLWEIDSLANLRERIRSEKWAGFNVTLPYKQAILPYLDELDDEARAIGAVNCVSVERSLEGGMEKILLQGHNTDWRGFLDSLQPLLQPQHKEALILGSGGAARAVEYALRQIGIGSTMVSREPEKHPGSIGYGEAYQQATEKLIIVNATPVGMYPRESETPWRDLHNIGMQHLCYDLIYNPEETRWLLESELTGAQVKNGMEMLERQAEASARIWRVEG